MVAPTGSPDELPIDVDLIKVLASDSRRDILRLLGERRRTLTELAEALGLKKATVLEHLQKLVAADLIKRLDDGDRLWVYYELSPRGKRLVRPERTRFYLILGGTALAALLLGAVIAAALLMPGGSLRPEEQGVEASAPMFDQTAGVRVPPVVWRGLDDHVPIEVPDAPADAWLMLYGAGGDATTVPLANGSAMLEAQLIDALAPGTYALSLASDAGEARLYQTLRIQEPAIALFPLALPANATVDVDVSLAPPAQPAPANVQVSFADAEQTQTGARQRFVVTAGAADVPVRVGRLFSTEIAAIPDFVIAYSRDNDTLRLDLSRVGGALVDADVTLDGALLGRTNESGVLLAPWPAQGEHALRIVASDGRAQERALDVNEDAIREPEPLLRLEALDARGPSSTGLRARAEVFNDGPAAQLVTVAAWQGDALLASQLVSVPAHGRAEALLVSPLARPDVVDITAHSARATVRIVPRAVFLGDGATRFSNETTNAPPVAAAPMAQIGVSEPGAPPSDARDTLYFAQATPQGATEASRENAPEARAPLASPLVLFVLVALAAWAIRRKR